MKQPIQSLMQSVSGPGSVLHALHLIPCKNQASPRVESRVGPEGQFALGGEGGHGQDSLSLPGLRCAQQVSPMGNPPVTVKPSTVMGAFIPTAIGGV